MNTPLACVMYAAVVTSRRVADAVFWRRCIRHIPDKSDTDLVEG